MERPQRSEVAELHHCSPSGKTPEPDTPLFYAQCFSPNWAPGLPSHTQQPQQQSLIVYRIRRIEQRLDNLTHWPILTKHLLFLVGGEKQTSINWECATNSYGNKVSKYLIIACVSKCLTTFAWRICKRAQASCFTLDDKARQQKYKFKC